MRPVLQKVHKIAVTHAGFIDQSLASCAFDEGTSELTVPFAWQRTCLMCPIRDTIQLRGYVVPSDMRIWLMCS